MKKALFQIIPLFLVFGLLTACSGASSAPAASETAASETQEPEAEATPAAEPEEKAPAAELTFDFDSKAYQNPDDDDYLNALAYATSSFDKPVMATVRVQALDEEGNVMSAFDQFKDRYIEQYRTDLYVPAGAERFPIGFTLPAGYRYDLKEGKEMPAVGHLEFEVLEIQEVDLADLKEHFTPGEPEIRENHIYIYVKFDEEIADHYDSLYPDYTLLGYKDGVVTSVICKRCYPYGTTSMSVSYAKEHNDSSLLVYHNVYGQPADTWELYLGCIGGE